MKNKYIDLIQQTFNFPQEEFQLEDNTLTFHDIYLMDLIKQYGTPLKFHYLPKISENIKKAKMWFNVAMAKCDYQAKYHYCYCTKSSHFQFVLEEALKNDIHIETSSAFDIDIIEALYLEGKITKQQFIISNGFKTDTYIENIARIINDGFENALPILDNKSELDRLTALTDKPFKIGIRLAAEEEPKFEFYTSRLGIGYKDIVPFYLDQIKDKPNVEVKMLHFFINTGIADTAYYWNELHKCLKVYCALKKVAQL